VPGFFIPRIGNANGVSGYDRSSITDIIVPIRYTAINGSSSQTRLGKDSEGQKAIQKF
jgi:hypothetical protein